LKTLLLPRANPYTKISRVSPFDRAGHATTTQSLQISERADLKEGKIAILNIDDTLADAGALHHLQKKPKTGKAFFGEWPRSGDQIEE